MIAVDDAWAVADASIVRSGPTLRHAEWRAELLQSGIRGKKKQNVEFTRIEPLGGTRYLHADGETKGERPERVVISFGPEHAPLEQRQVELAWDEARTLNPKPTLLVFAAFQFDPEAAKDIVILMPKAKGIAKGGTGYKFSGGRLVLSDIKGDMRIPLGLR